MLMSPGPKIKLKEGVTPYDVGERMTVGGAKQASNVLNSGYEVATSDDHGLEWLNKGGLKELGNQLFGNSLFSLVDIYDNISLTLGNFFMFPSVVITDVSSDYGIKLDAITGLPIELSATVSFRTFVSPKAEDVDMMLRQLGG
jgi:hypothetical protein